MTKFKYRASKQSGQIVTGVVEGSSHKEVIAKLEKDALTPLSVEAGQGLVDSFRLPALTIFQTKVKTVDLIIFSRQLASLLKSGVTLIEGIASIREQVTTPVFKEVLKEVKKDVEEGLSFSAALEKHPKVFSPFVVNMVLAGEKGGILAKSLERVSIIIDKDQQTQNKIKSAIRYPALVLFSLVIGFFFVVMMVIPQFSSFFNSFSAQLPLPTRILVSTNEFVRSSWYYIILTLAVLATIFIKWRQTAKGAFLFDKFLLALPLIGEVLKKLTLARFSRMLSEMLIAGVNIVDALSVSSKICDNKVIEQAVMQLRESVIQGEGLSKPMHDLPLFPPVVTQMVAVGEKAGNLDEMLGNVAAYFDNETDYTVTNLTSYIEPILIFVLGLFVLLLALGVYLPMWNLSQIYTK